MNLQVDLVALGTFVAGIIIIYVFIKSSRRTSVSCKLLPKCHYM